MEKRNFIFALLALLLTTAVWAYNNEQTTPDAITGATAQNSSTRDDRTGKSDITAEDIIGVWGDAVGLAAYSSEETLNAAGGTSATDAIARGINEMMGRMDVSNGTVEFTSDGKVIVITASGETMEGTYKISGATITAYAMGNSFDISASMQDGMLRLFYPVERMPQQILRFFTDYNTEGLNLGVQLKKK